MRVFGATMRRRLISFAAVLATRATAATEGGVYGPPKSPKSSPPPCPATAYLGPNVGRCHPTTRLSVKGKFEERRGLAEEDQQVRPLTTTAICRRIHNQTCACGARRRLRRAAARTVPPRGERVCAIVRTYAGHAPTIRALLQTLHATTAAAGLSLEANLLNTDQDPLGDCYTRQLVAEKERADSAGPAYTLRVRRPHAHTYSLPEGVRDWGYFQTDLELLALTKRGGCDYFLVTNGDNVYDVDFAHRLLAALDANRGLAAAASDFYCHTHRGVVTVEFRVTRIDLGGMLVRASYFQRTNATFLLGDLGRRVPLTSIQVAMSDGRFARRLQQNGGGATVPELLFYHL